MKPSSSAEAEFTVRAELGLHARPAGKFVALAGHYDCEISVAREDEWVSGSSVLSILSLAAAQGTTLRIRAEGADAVVAVWDLGALLEDPEGGGLGVS